MNWLRSVVFPFLEVAFDIPLKGFRHLINFEFKQLFQRMSLSECHPLKLNIK